MQGQGVSPCSPGPGTIVVATHLTPCPRGRDKLDQRQGQGCKITPHKYALLDFSTF